MVIATAFMVMSIALPLVNRDALKFFTFSLTSLKDDPIFYFVLFGTIIAAIIDRRSGLSIRFPFILVVVFLNFLFVVLVAFGLSRFIEVMDFLFILCAIQYLWSWMLAGYSNTLFQAGSEVSRVE